MSAPIDIPDELPAALALFPLPGVLLLPGMELPLNIFEPRYLDMVRDAMAGARMIGMVQPRDPQDSLDHPEVYDIGCAGVITAFKETDDGRFLITLTGLCRFGIVQELETMTKYRQVNPDWQRFEADRFADPEALDNRTDFQDILATYFKAHAIDVDWKSINAAGDQELVNFLAMICPFAPAERQALLECSDLLGRARTMATLMAMAVQAHNVGLDDDEDGLDDEPPQPN
jgi:Lon protease-like protein